MGGTNSRQVFENKDILTTFSDVTVDQILRNGQYLKTVKCNHKTEGSIVMKILYQHTKADREIEVLDYITIQDFLSEKLYELKNVATFKQFVNTEKAFYLIRQHFQNNLHDRITSRPHLTEIEKQWIVYQLMKGLSNVHELNVYHGDIKTENIMLTSWNWVFLTDFGNYKPVIIEEDSPIEFSNYFDRSGRRTCYVAPERFGKKNEVKIENQLTAEMDLFSLGCVIYELFSDGTSLFSLSDLIKYKQNEFNPTEFINRITNSKMRQLVDSMIQLKPEKRGNIKEYLDEKKGFFPSYFKDFYDYIYQLMKHSAEDKVLMINNDFENISQLIKNHKKIEKQMAMEKLRAPIDLTLSYTNRDQYIIKISSVLTSSMYHSKLQENHDPFDEFNNDEINDTEILEGFYIILSVLCSSISQLESNSIKVVALKLLNKISKHVDDKCRLQIILPFVTDFLHENHTIIRCLSISIITSVLGLVESFPPSDILIFNRYIMPYLLDISKSYDLLVLSYLAKNLSKLAAISMSFSEAAASMINSVTQSLIETKDQQTKVHENNRIALVDLFVQTVNNLFSLKLIKSESKPILTQTPTSATAPFSPVVIHRPRSHSQKLNNTTTTQPTYSEPLPPTQYSAIKSSDSTNDNLLNDQDQQVRAHSAHHLSLSNSFDEELNQKRGQELLYNSTIDEINNDQLVPSIFNNFCSGIGDLILFFGKKLSTDYLLALLMNIVNKTTYWEIRYAFFKTVPSMFKPLGYYIIKYHILPFLFDNLYSPDEKIILAILECFHAFVPFNRSKRIYYTIIKRVSPLLLHPNKLIRKKTAGLICVINLSFDNFDKCKLRKLLKEYLTDTSIPFSEPILLSTMHHSLSRKTYNLLVDYCKLLPKYKQNELYAPILLTSNLEQRNQNQLPSLSNSSIPPPDENGFKHMLLKFIQENEILGSDKLTLEKLTEYFKELSNSDLIQTAEEFTTAISSFDNKEVYGVNNIHSNSLHNKRLFLTTARFPTQVSGFGNKLHSFAWKETEGLFTEESEESPSAFFKSNQLQLPTWNLSNSVITSIHQHTSSVNQLALTLDENFFVSCSADKTVKLWSLEPSKLNRCVDYIPERTIAAESAVNCILIDDKNIIYGTQDGSIYCDGLFEPHDTRLHHFPKEEIVKLIRISDWLIVAFTKKGNGYGIDLRDKHVTFTIAHELPTGQIKAAIGDVNCNYFITGSSRGIYTCWDYRIQLPFSTWQQFGRENSINSLAFSNGTSFHGFYSGVCNSSVYHWNLETCSSVEIFSAHEPRLSSQADVTITDLYGRFNHLRSHWHKMPESETINALFALPDCNLLAGGSDQCVRYWDAKNTRKSQIISQSSKGILKTSYSTENLGSKTIHKETVDAKTDEFNIAGNRSTIVDLLAVNSSKMILSASMDGVIKVSR